MRSTPIYGLDIETDTTIDGLDPSVSRIVAIALSTGVDELFEGDEDEILWGLDQRLRTLPPGVIATWNGSAFDLPFIADRSGLWQLPIGLHIEADPRIRHRHACHRRTSSERVQDGGSQRPKAADRGLDAECCCAALPRLAA